MENLPKDFAQRKLIMLQALQELCQSVSVNGVEPPLTAWPKTRELADLCSESIYTSRWLLLTLVKEGKAQCSPQRIQNSLRWFTARLKEIEQE